MKLTKAEIESAEDWGKRTWAHMEWERLGLTDAVTMTTKIKVAEALAEVETRVANKTAQLKTERKRHEETKRRLGEIKKENAALHKRLRELEQPVVKTVRRVR